MLLPSLILIEFYSSQTVPCHVNWERDPVPQLWHGKGGKTWVGTSTWRPIIGKFPIIILLLYNQLRPLPVKVSWIRVRLKACLVGPVLYLSFHLLTLFLFECSFLLFVFPSQLFLFFFFDILRNEFCFVGKSSH